ncbi:hypothetical protein ACJVC5_04210 [Peredibacter sp. HCB2-198]|uniref:hypothetical protein n=1 Tax=Peredibacter sp. HCB2-198 TaxID=3383025 RepID=UPI0038B4F564
MIRLIALFLISLNVMAAPRDIEVWFVSNSKVSLLNDLLNRPQYIYRAPTAALECQEMGDYCFDPQFGLYKKENGIEETVETKKIETEGPSIPAGKSVERELIDCDPKNYFDIFCGKARKEAAPQVSKLDLWIDTSSSMREFDFSDASGGCHRKSLVRVLDDACGFNQKVNVMMFDTTIKQAGSMDSLCLNQGLNDYKRLMDWIERSDAKKLVIITDIYEFHKEFSDYIESKHGKLRGDKEPLTAKQMVELADSLAKSCK